MARFTALHMHGRALRYVWVLLLALFCPFAASAQDDLNRWEVNGGFSYLHLSAPGLPEKRNSYGAWGGMAYYLTRHSSVAVEFAGHKNPSCAQNDIECIIEQLSQPLFVTYSSIELLGGPRISTGGRTFDWFGHVMVGLARTRATVIDLETEESTVTKSGARFAAAFGGGMDWNLHDQFALRLFQVDYLPVSHTGGRRNNIRVQVGAVVRFGARR